jgi:hypothetical protein
MNKHFLQKKVASIIIAGIAAVLVLGSTAHIFSFNLAQASNDGNGGNNHNDNSNGPSSTNIPGNKANPQGSDAGCTGNPHDFSQPTGNPHDSGNPTGNPHECPATTESNGGGSSGTSTGSSSSSGGSSENSNNGNQSSTGSTTSTSSTGGTSVNATSNLNVASTSSVSTNNATRIANTNVVSSMAGSGCAGICPQLETVELRGASLAQSSVMPLVSEGTTSISQAHILLNAPASTGLQLVVAQIGSSGVLHAVTVNFVKVVGVGSNESLYQANVSGSVSGTNPFTGQADTVSNITDLMLRNSAAQTIMFANDDTAAISVMCQH